MITLGPQKFDHIIDDHNNAIFVISRDKKKVTQFAINLCCNSKLRFSEI